MGTKYLVHCQTGYRSMIASSILRSYDFEVMEIKDGLQGFIKSNNKLEIISVEEILILREKFL